MSTFSWLNNIYKKFKSNNYIDINSNGVRSMSIYNTEQNFIVLIEYNPLVFYDVIEFLNYASNSRLKILISHSNREVLEQEESRMDIKPRKNYKFVENRYYLIISGEPGDYANALEYIPLSNIIMENIMQEVYQNISSTEFNDYIKDNVISLDSFKYKKVRPNYDELKSINNDLLENHIMYYDDIETIKSRLPSCVSTLDLASIIHLYFNKDFSNRIDYLYINATDLINKYHTLSLLESNKNTNMTSQLATTIMHIKLLKPLWEIILPYYDENNLDLLTILSSPIYLKSELDEDDLSYADLPISKLDQIFQETYDKFNNPSIDSAIYKNIDEVLTNNTKE